MIERLRHKLLVSNEQMEVGRYSYGHPTILSFPSGARVRIGSFCSIAENVFIVLGGEHAAGRATTYPLNALWEEDLLPHHESTRGDVEIGSDVWIGFGAIILSGSKIGHGAIVGAGAVVSGEVPPFAVVAGNPARVLRFRFEAPTIQALLELRWWEWPEAEIRERAAELMGDATTFCMNALLSKGDA